MKTKILILGCLVTCLCFLGCNKDDKIVKVSGITVSPTTIPLLQKGETVELEATVSPSDTQEDILWVSWDKNKVTVEAVEGTNGRKAILTALGGGATRIFATSASKIVVSEDINVAVDSDDIAGLLIEEEFIGQGKMTGPMPGDIKDAIIKFERIGEEKLKVQMSVTVVLAIGENTMVSDITIMESSTEGIYLLSGECELDAIVAKLEFVITGSYNVSTEVLTLDMEDKGMDVKINITAEHGTSEPPPPPPPNNYAGDVAGEYIGAGLLHAIPLFSVPDTELEDVAITFEEVDNGTVKATLMIEMFGQPVTLTGNITVSETYTLSGNVSGDLVGLPISSISLPMSGSFDPSDHTLVLNFNGMAVIDLTADPVIPPKDLGGEVAGEYTASGLLLAIPAFSVPDTPLEGLEITFVRIDNNTVDASIVTELFGQSVTFTGEVTVSETYALSGTVTGIIDLGTGGGPGPLPLSLSGSFDPDNQTLTITLSGMGGMITINLTAEPYDLTAKVAGEYIGAGELLAIPTFGVPDTPLDGLEITFVRIDKSTVDASIVTELFSQEVTFIGEVTVSETCALSGTVTGIIDLGTGGGPGPLPLSLSGSFDPTGQTFTFTLSGLGGMVTINLTAEPAE